MERDFPMNFILEGSQVRIPSFAQNSLQDQCYESPNSAILPPFPPSNIPHISFFSTNAITGDADINYALFSNAFNEDRATVYQNQFLSGEKVVDGRRITTKNNLHGLKMPKLEPIDEDTKLSTVIQDPCSLAFSSYECCLELENFNEEVMARSSSSCKSPDLRCTEKFSDLEMQPNNLSSKFPPVGCSAKQQRFPSSLSPTHALHGHRKSVILTNPGSHRSITIPNNILARQRRKKTSDRIHCLEKLMPWERKMDRATLLLEVYRYIKFLEAQVKILKCMPIHSNYSFSHVYESSELRKLNRQQFLEIMLNSQMIQEKLYERELCVYSAEQVAMLQQKYGAGMTSRCM